MTLERNVSIGRRRRRRTKRAEDGRVRKIKRQAAGKRRRKVPGAAEDWSGGRFEQGRRTEIGVFSS